MDKNTFTGLFLILVILVASTFLLKPNQEEIKRKAEQDSIAVAKEHPESQKKVAKKTAASITSVITAEKDSSAVPTGIIKEKLYTLENQYIKISISNIGARIASVELREETTYQGKPVILFNDDNTHFGLVYKSNGKEVNTSSLAFNLVSQDEHQIVMRMLNPDGSFVNYAYSLNPNSHKVDFKMEVQGFQNKINTKNITLDWETKLLQQERDLNNERMYSTTYYNTVDDGVDYLSEAKDEQKVLDKSKVKWVAFKQHFFSGVIISNEGFDKADVKIETLADKSAVKAYGAKMSLPFKNQDTNTYNLQFYFGSNKFSQLKDQGDELEQMVKMGWGPLKWINRYLVLPIFNFFQNMNLGYGLIILLLTIILKSVLFPFTYKSYLSMAKMRVLKPEMEEIKKRVGEENQALVQQEYLKLYKQAGVNPLGGCLPMVFQMPFILAFFYFFPNLFELRHQSFLWMHDLSTYDDFFKLGFTLPFIGNHISLMCVLMTISTLIYTYFNNQVSGAQGQMKYIGYITPIIFFGVLNSYPSGLNYYYFCANILTFSQQFLIRKFVDDDKIHAQIQENKKKPDSKKKQGGFQKKLEDMMRQQQQQQKK
ncbi:MAG: membrane protein insertase YidC [Sphingobacteriales bacterium]|nr:membrane protein insertase YidC [Sphingobacteriales bacterium]